jgi:hypothetical protein
MLAFSPEEGKKTIPVKTARPANEFDGDWPALAGRLGLSGGARELARNAELKNSSGDTFELAVPKSMAHLAGESYRESL